MKKYNKLQMKINNKVLLQIIIINDVIRNNILQIIYNFLKTSLYTTLKVLFVRLSSLSKTNNFNPSLL